jgi:hypothetical protein
MKDDTEDRKLERARHLARANRERRLAYIEDRETAEEIAEVLREMCAFLGTLDFGRRVP